MNPITCQQCDCEINVSESGDVSCGCPADEGPSCPDLDLPLGAQCPLCGWHPTHVVNLADGRRESFQIEGRFGFGHMGWSVNEVCDTILHMRDGWFMTERYAKIADPTPIA